MQCSYLATPCRAAATPKPNPLAYTLTVANGTPTPFNHVEDYPTFLQSNVVQSSLSISFNVLSLSDLWLYAFVPPRWQGCPNASAPPCAGHLAQPRSAIAVTVGLMKHGDEQRDGRRSSGSLPRLLWGATHRNPTAHGQLQQGGNTLVQKLRTFCNRARQQQCTAADVDVSGWCSRTTPLIAAARHRSLLSS